MKSKNTGQRSNMILHIRLIPREDFKTQNTRVFLRWKYAKNYTHMTRYNTRMLAQDTTKLQAILEYTPLLNLLRKRSSNNYYKIHDFFLIIILNNILKSSLFICVERLSLLFGTFKLFSFLKHFFQIESFFVSFENQVNEGQ